MQFIYKLIKNRIDKASYYTIKLVCETNVHSKNLIKPQLNSQVLFTLLCVAHASSLPYKNDHSISSFRYLMLKCADFDDPKNTLVPLCTKHCVTHKDNQTCFSSIMEGVVKNIKMLGNLYFKLNLFTSILTKNKDPIYLIKRTIKSTTFLTLFTFITRVFWCHLKNLNGVSTNLDCQMACALGSLAFIIEDKDRREIINKYMMYIYINSFIRHLKLDEKLFWKISLPVAIIYSLKNRGIVQTLFTFAF